MEFNSLDNSSKVWIYACNRTLDASELLKITQRLDAFLKEWSAHGAALFAAYQIEVSQIVIVAVDERLAAASGCSIDKLVHLFQDLGRELNVDFFDRMLVAYEKDDNVHFTKLNNFWAMKKANLIADSTIIYDTTVKTLDEWKSGWKKPFKDSWHADAWGR